MVIRKLNFVAGFESLQGYVGHSRCHRCVGPRVALDGPPFESGKAKRLDVYYCRLLYSAGCLGTAGARWLVILAFLLPPVTAAIGSLKVRRRREEVGVCAELFGVGTTTKLKGRWGRRQEDERVAQVDVRYRACPNNGTLAVRRKAHPSKAGVRHNFKTSCCSQ